MIDLKKPTTDAKHFYVSAIDGDKRYLVAGPYASHADALAAVACVKEHAIEQDQRAFFMAWGTAGSATSRKTPLGVFSKGG